MNALLLLASLFVADPELRVIRFCDLPGAQCPDVEDYDGTGTTPQELNWCCGYDGTPCTLIAMISDCDPELEYAVICDWGRMLPDGTVECFD